MSTVSPALSHDALKELYEALHTYVASGERLETFLSVTGKHIAHSSSPVAAVRLINDSYSYGALHLFYFVLTEQAWSAAQYNANVQEAERCITETLFEVYGVRKGEKVGNENLTLARSVAPDANLGTAEEQRVKRELCWVLVAGSVRKEIDALRDAIKRIASDKEMFPVLNTYARSPKEFDRRTRPIVVALELEALPARHVVWRVERFLYALHRRVSEALALVAANDEEKKQKKS